MSCRKETRHPPEDRLLTAAELDSCDVSVTIREIQELRRELDRAMRKLRFLRATKLRTLSMRHVDCYLGLSMANVRKYSSRMKESLRLIDGFQGWINDD